MLRHEHTAEIFELLLELFGVWPSEQIDTLLNKLQGFDGGEYKRLR